MSPVFLYSFANGGRGDGSQPQGGLSKISTARSAPSPRSGHGDSIPGASESGALERGKEGQAKRDAMDSDQLPIFRGGPAR